MYRLRRSKKVNREINRLPGHVRQRMRRLIASLAKEPRPAKAKELRELPNRFRIALNKWRLIYKVDDERREVIILAVRLKRGPETYEDLE